MSQYGEILAQVPVGQLADRFGVGEGDITQAAEQALPALLGGLNANADDPAGASSILEALTQHQGQVPDDLEQIDEQDGQRIVRHIFGDNTGQVQQQLGGLGGGATGDLVKKLLPILAPIVLSWLAKKMSQQGGLGGVLGDVLGGGAGAGGQSAPSRTGQPDSGPLFPGGQGAQSGPVQAPAGTGSAPGSQGSNPLQDILGDALDRGGTGAGSIIGDILGGLLGGGRR